MREVYKCSGSACYERIVSETPRPICGVCGRVMYIRPVIRLGPLNAGGYGAYHIADRDRKKKHS